MSAKKPYRLGDAVEAVILDRRGFHKITGTITDRGSLWLELQDKEGEKHRVKSICCWHVEEKKA